jgi:acyl-coenzyme A thioesterase PaaI-like protein
MNFRLAEVAHGRAVFRGAPLFDHMNPLGGVHGGWYGTLLDSCMGCAVMTKPCRKGAPTPRWNTR